MAYIEKKTAGSNKKKQIATVARKASRSLRSASKPVGIAATVTKTNRATGKSTTTKKTLTPTTYSIQL